MESIGFETERNRWDDLADKVLAGGAISRDEARAVLDAPTDELRPILLAALRVREQHFGRKVKLCLLQNARSGLCPEDCGYCSQSIVSTAEIDKYRMLSEEKLFRGAEHAVEQGARRYCMVTSGRGPSKTDVGRICDATRKIKSKWPDLEICACLGLLDRNQADELKGAGVGWVNHNLNTSEKHHPEVVSTHTYADRLRTLQNVKDAGLSICSGGIIGMGEGIDDVVELAFALREVGVDSLPVNFLHAIEGTPLGDSGGVDPVFGLKALSMFRFVNPTADVRAAGGREKNLAEWQPLAVFPASSIFVQGYLTTLGQSPDDARSMIENMGFEVEIGEVESAG